VIYKGSQYGRSLFCPQANFLLEMEMDFLGPYLSGKKIGS
jgi:hypothetical protein